MAEFPKTRISLVLRLAHREDVHAWHEFCELYAPILYRIAASKGLQKADAEDVTQDILFAVARAAERFQPDASRARFRTWLSRIARNLIADFFAGRAKRPVSQALSESGLQSICDEASEPHEFDSAFGMEHRRSVFQLAARRVQGRVARATWQAFYRTAVEQIPDRDAAEQLRMTLGGLYVARCRVLKMLREEVELLEQVEHSKERTQ